jgi:hypothetical protein
MEPIPLFIAFERKGSGKSIARVIIGFGSPVIISQFGRIVLIKKIRGIASWT